MQEKGKKILLSLTVLLLAGLLWSRAVLSITTVLWLLYAVYLHRNTLPTLVKTPLVWWSFTPVLLFGLGIYQQPLAASNHSLWMNYCIYPVAGLSALAVTKLQFTRSFVRLWIHAALLAMLYPLGWFVLHSAEAIAQYGAGQSLPVFMSNDHLRFGMFICSALLLSLLPENPLQFKKTAFILLTGSVLFLSVRTAWVMAFILLGGFSLYSLMSASDKTRVLFRTAALVIMTAAALWFLPTAGQKIRYTIYDWEQFNSKGYDSTYSDGVRRAINTAAWQYIQNNEQVAAGWAAVPAKLRQQFAILYNGSAPPFGWPFNQWLFWWMGSGWWGMLLYTGWLFFPACYGWKTRNPFLVIWTLAIAASCLVESNLNYQFGAFLHAWPLALLWHYKKQAPADFT
ncbi:MAG TPA: hypothetical protein VJ552_11155 [Sediminibacterium sp.]|nr:hypothetical protein [Sediminibacterium sp.]